MNNKTQFIYKHNLELRLSNHHCYGKEVFIPYSECVFVALVIQHALHMRCIVLSFVDCLCLLRISTLSFVDCLCLLHISTLSFMDCLCLLHISTLSFMDCLCLLHISTLSQKRKDFQKENKHKKHCWTNNVSLTFCTTFI
jgi:hypothetical protein